MLLAKLAKKFSAGLWKFLRPTELLQGVVDCSRVALRSASYLPESFGTGRTPVAIGQGYSILSLPMAQISRSTLVCGVETPPSFKEFPYMLVGAPRGILYFCRSPQVTGWSKYHDFVEVDGVYFFKQDPTIHGVVTSRGEERCTFLTFNPAKRETTFQDPEGVFCGSVDAEVNKAVAAFDIECAALNGVDQRLVGAACGSKTSNDEIRHVWQEGEMRLALTVSDELLYGPVDAPIAGTVFISDSGTFTYSEDADIISAKEADGILSADSTCGPTDNGAHRALSRRMLPVSSRTLYQRLEISVPGSEDSNRQVTGMYVYYSRAASSAQPLVCTGVHPLDAIYGNIPAFGVSRIQFEENATDIVSLNGEEYGSPLCVGATIMAVSFISAGTEPMNDVILSHVQLRPTNVNVGDCIIFKLKY